MGIFKRLFQFLLSPTAKYSVLTLAGGGIILGVISVVAFDATMHATSTEEFCTSCHEMADNPGMMLVGTTHHMNKSGVRPGCSDCHVPKEFIPKMIRKIEASREVWGSITGIIDTPEKYAAHAPRMKEREIARLKANDSQECRNCHDVNHMLSAAQTSKAQSFHKVLKTGKRTCIDCHAGLTHTAPEQISQLQSGH
ncbi:MAG: NapC/NirT family cytochrome c [Halieaceae bacterium]